MIVKVQLSLTTNATKRQALIYNESRSVMMQVPVTVELLKRMTLDGETKPKLFFNAHIEGKNIVLDDYAKWEEW